MSGEPDESAEYQPTGLELARSLTAAVRARTTRADAPSRPGRRRSRVTPVQSSGARPDDRDPQLLGRTVGRLVADHGWAEEINVHTLLGRWPLLVGHALAEHTVVEAYVDRVVTVRASSTAWATQLRGLAATVVARLNDQLGDGTVVRIQVLGPDVPSWKRGRRSVPGRGPRDTYG